MNRIKSKFEFAAVMAVALMTGIVGCSSDGDDDNDGSDNTYTGYFIDSPVSGLNYVVVDSNDVETHSGVTGSDGSFSHHYSAGSEEVVTFSIGGITFPSIDVVEIVTPFNLANSSSINNPSVVNMIQLLLSLDSDGDPSNGISITDATHTAAANLTTLDFASETFDADVANLIANSGSTNTALVGEEAAKSHFNATLSGMLDTSVITDVADIKFIMENGHWTDGCVPNFDSEKAFAASTSQVTFSSNGAIMSNGVEWDDAACTQSIGTYSFSAAWNLGDVVTAPDGHPAVTLNLIIDGSVESMLARMVSGYLYMAGGDSGTDFSEGDIYFDEN